MHRTRAEGFLLLTAASIFGPAGCRDQAAGGPPRHTTAAAEAAGPSSPLGVADIAAYVRGRSREILIVRAALDRLRRAGTDSVRRHAALADADAPAVERAGALAAGLPEGRYRDLTTRVDSALLAKGASAASDDPERDDRIPADEWRLLDSLRVDLAVLRSRFEAAAGEEAVAR